MSRQADQRVSGRRNWRDHRFPHVLALAAIALWLAVNLPALATYRLPSENSSEALARQAPGAQSQCPGVKATRTAGDPMVRS